MGKTKLLTLTISTGFLVGAICYFIFSWLTSGIATAQVPIMEMVLAPWFISGLAGSALSLIVVMLVAYTQER